MVQANRDPGPKTCSHYEHIKKPQGAICRIPIPPVFQLRVCALSENNMDRSVFFIVISCRFTCLFLSRDYLFPSFLFRSPFPPLSRPSPFLFSAVHTRSLLAAAGCSEPINQCGIFALAGLTERPRCHLWTLKRVANIAKQEITNCCELWNTYEHLRDRRSLFPSSVPVAAFVACSASLQFPSCVRRRLRLCLSCHVISLVFPSD